MYRVYREPSPTTQEGRWEMNIKIIPFNDIRNNRDINF